MAQEAHALKGLCGNLAMKPLSRLFSQLEVAARSQQAQAAARILAQIQKATREAEVDLALLQSGTESRPDSGAEVQNKMEILPTLERLLTAAQHNEYDQTALDVLLRQAQSGSQSVQNIAEAFNNFDFGAAVQLLSDLRDRLSNEEE